MEIKSLQKSLFQKSLDETERVGKQAIYDTQKRVLAPNFVLQKSN